MWINDQYHAVPQHLTHCPIDRQRNPCNFTGMQLFIKKSRGTERGFHTTQMILQSQTYGSVQTDRAELAHIVHDGSSGNRVAALQDRHAELRRSDAYLKQYDEELSDEPACRQVYRSSGSAIAAEALMNYVG